MPKATPGGGPHRLPDAAQCRRCRARPAAAGPADHARRRRVSRCCWRAPSAARAAGRGGGRAGGDGGHHRGPCRARPGAPWRGAPGSTRACWRRCSACRATPSCPPRRPPSAYEDRPLPIGHGQTISQPFIVALMTDLLRTAPEHVVLEVGTGSGYQAAVLAELVRQVHTDRDHPAAGRSGRAAPAGPGLPQRHRAPRRRLLRPARRPPRSTGSS